MKERNTQLFEAAQLYYLEHLTMDQVGARLSVSRATVSRLLKEARQVGLVQINLNDDFKPKNDLATKLGDRFRVKALVVPTNPRDSALGRMQAVAREAGVLLNNVMHDDMVLGVAWGSTVSEVARQLPPRPLKNALVVQLNGAGNARHTGIPYSGAILGQIAEAFSAQMIHFPVPAFFDRATTKEAMWQEESVRSVLKMQRVADVALFGIGAFGGAIPSHVYNGGYFTEEEQRRLRQTGVVGDMCTVFLRENGTFADLEVNRRATGPTPAELVRIKRRIAVVSGAHRLSALMGALMTGAVTDLVIDAQLAELLLKAA
ncbi:MULTISPECIES: sugar-binding transcriptional regulator [Rothia]|uniref:Transcriptional regulator n=1 Tax=Rothia amarae TaxID=169480 RepID=A0A7H2BHU1_9MICC|nr:MULTISPECIES: sugar-binding domain-containing protein [Rothia]QNV39237.1 transcriptional regulator [Rothia amarae]SIL71210.1 transcriptional regulator [Mycobacteroides abscessus subsp. abscessus]